MNDFRRKTKTAMWFVSHCDMVTSNRAALAQKLQDNGIDVDSYGNCGKKSCKNFDCPRQLHLAKFYLAFENSLCTDYVTEKIYKVVDLNVIPVAFTGANLSYFLPPKSYIDANAFQTVEELAKYLRYLSDNPPEFAKYFWWKKYYKVKLHHMVRGPQICKICKKLNEPNLWEKNQFYRSIKDWYGKGMCKNASIKF